MYGGVTGIWQRTISGVGTTFYLYKTIFFLSGSLILAFITVLGMYIFRQYELGPDLNLTIVRPPNGHNSRCGDNRLQYRIPL